MNEVWAVFRMKSLLSSLAAKLIIIGSLDIIINFLIQTDCVLLHILTTSG